jgi:phenylacetate-coenzyme A ligase PaaK-like adenylate-forming protein
VRKLTENDAKSQRVLLNLGTLQKNKKREEEEKKKLAEKKNKFVQRSRASGTTARPHT